MCERKMSDKHDYDDTNNNIFVKRETDEVKTSLIQTPVASNGHVEELAKTQNSPKDDSFFSKIGRWLDKFKIKSGLAHIGLLMSLAAYTAAGGFVRI